MRLWRLDPGYSFSGAASYLIESVACRYGHAARAQESRPIRPAPAPVRPPRRPIRDNPRLLLVGIALLVIALAGLLALAGRTTSFSPDFLTEVVLYALSVADLTMLVALVFVLARNIIKLVVERRRGLPFARFRAKLVAVLLGMTLIPSILVLIVGSELIRNSADRWFNAPMDEVLSSANRIASDYYAERQRFVVDQAGRIARGLSSVELTTAERRGSCRCASRPRSRRVASRWSRFSGWHPRRGCPPTWRPCSTWRRRPCRQARHRRRQSVWPAEWRPARPRHGCSSRSAEAAS